MNITEELKVKIQHIVDSVPISYYCGQRISLCLDPNIRASNYNFFTQAIQISLKQICIALTNIDDTDNGSVEETIRSLVYHELSHAMLSPSALFEKDYILNGVKIKKPFPNKLFFSLINIVEDERIENTMQNFFYGINFKRLVALMNSNFEVESPLDEFYGIVRLGIGPQEDIDYANRCIKKYMYLNSTDFNKSAQEDYLERILILFSRVLKRWPENYNLANLAGPSEDDLLSVLSDVLNGEASNKATKSNSQTSITKEDIKKALNDLIQAGAGTGKSYNTTKCINTWLHNVQSNKVLTKLRRLIDELQKSCGNDRAAVNGYSGRISPTLAGREDYRFFVNTSRNGSHRAGRKLKLNLFLDNSGSYEANAEATNNLLCALNTLRLDGLLDLSIVTIGNNTAMHDIDHFGGITANEGTSVNDDLFNHYKQSLTPGAINKNIVLLDGLVHDSSSKDKSALSVFNSSDTLAIIDKSNEDKFKRHAPNARLLVMGKDQVYSEKLIDYVIIELSRLFR